jgi:hypothetical protein
MPSLRERQPSDSLAAALERYASLGGILEYVVFEPASAVSTETHREAAVLGMDAIHRRPCYFDLNFYSAPGDPKAISALDFVGPFYDWQAETLINPWVDGGGGARLRHSCICGYADAFLDPPHGLGIALSEASALFRAINRDLFGMLTPELDVRSWPTDWCDFFDAGLEWWGAFYWTIHATRTNLLVVIGASTTD